MPGDEGKKYESRIDIIKPDGEPIGGSEFSFVMQKQFRITQIKGTHFPIGIEGVHTARIAIREVDGEWEIVGTYPVDVEYDLSESENDDAPDKEVKDDV